MNMIERYDAALDARAAEFRAEAARAEAAADERGHSLALMQASMLGDMLKQLGRAEHAGRRGVLQKLADAAAARSQAALDRGDHDAADQEQIKARTILWAKQALEALEAGHE